MRVVPRIRRLIRPGMQRTDCIPGFFYAQARTGGFAANAACGPRGEQWKRAFPARFLQARTGKFVNAAYGISGKEELLWKGRTATGMLR